MVMDMGSHMLPGVNGSHLVIQVLVPGLEERAREFPALSTMILKTGVGAFHIQSSKWHLELGTCMCGQACRDHGCRMAAWAVSCTAMLQSTNAGRPLVQLQCFTPLWHVQGTLMPPAPISVL